MFSCRYCPCCYYVVIIPGYYFLSLLFLLLLWLFSLLLASPADVVAVAALCLSLANKVDVVGHRLATRHVLPLAGVVPTAVVVMVV